MNTVQTLDRMVAVLDLWADHSYREYEAGDRHSLDHFLKFGALADKAQAVRHWLAQNPRALD